MPEFISIHATGADWRSLCDQVLAGLEGRGPRRLAFIYIADEVAGDSDRIIDYLRGHSGIPHWVGCVAMGLCSNGRETYDEAALAVLATPFTDDEFRLIPSLGDDPSDWLAATSDWRTRTMASVAVVHGDPTANELPAQLVSFSDALQGGFLIGGIASASELPVQIADRAVSGGLSGVLFSASVAINTGLTQGCSLIGSRHQITRAQRNIIETIDDHPALDVFKETIGEPLASDLRRVGGLIFAALPISGSDTGDYLVRNLIGVDPDDGLLAIGDLVEPGMEIQFARRDAQTARDDLRHMVEGLLKRLPGPPRGALYHSCLGRGRNQFGDDSAELKLVGELLGDVPLAGFYANGEISHNRLYGYTGVLTLFS
ncbi:MAG: FIST C-terminal domain-containing protein [Gammaproteobacteria bacterium]|nr:FIST C-terminal domain-containing protein [Gammaproteobacteria bacterium]